MNDMETIGWRHNEVAGWWAWDVWGNWHVQHNGSLREGWEPTADEAREKARRVYEELA